MNPHEIRQLVSELRTDLHAIRARLDALERFRAFFIGVAVAGGMLSGVGADKVLHVLTK